MLPFLANKLFDTRQKLPLPRLMVELNPRKYETRSRIQGINLPIPEQRMCSVV